MATTPTDAPMLDDYTKAQFPLDVKWGNGTTVRLYGTMSGSVFGVSFFTREVDGETREDFSQSLHWDGQGIYGGGGYPSMNLAPPPAAVVGRIAEIRTEIAAAQARLDAMPDAPVEWRRVDEANIDRLNKTLEQLA